MENVISQRVRKLRKMHRLSQSEFGEKVGVTHATISRIESGDNLSTELMHRICKEFNIEISNLLLGDGIFKDGLHSEGMEVAGNRPEITTESTSVAVQELVNEVNFLRERIKKQEELLERKEKQLELKEKQLDVFIEKYVKLEVSENKPQTLEKEIPVVQMHPKREGAKVLSIGYDQEQKRAVANF